MSAPLFEIQTPEDLYDDKTYLTRLERIKGAFEEKYGCPPEVCVRAPGRVNLIGEHVDYCGFPVLPISIQQDVVIMGRVDPDSHTLTISNTNPDFPDFTCPARNVTVTEVKWHSYVLAGYLGIVERINSIPRGLQLTVDGIVPMSAGLSSSSALVCASALFTASVYQDGAGGGMSREEMAELCARSERFVGTQGGGMDQAISFLGVRGKAQLINFNPVRCGPVTLPDSVTFLVANCMVNKWKADGCDFNNRVAECRLGTKVLACKLGLDWREIKTYYILMSSSSLTPALLLEKIQGTFKVEPYSKKEIKEILECTDEEFAGIVGKSNNTSFRLLDRGEHVAGEAARVAEFHKLCTEEHPDTQRLGKLLNESHASLRDKYNVSIEELDTLTELCRRSGAAGSRLVGAGFGGCTISMVNKNIVESFKQAVWEGYYKDRDIPFESACKDLLFVTSPCAGASLLHI